MKNNKRKIPGMLYILFSFVPWIIYWVLCGMGNRLGVVIPFAISLILIVPQIRKRDFNLMDVTSVFYFSAATTATFIFNLNIFIERSGFLGYFALFSMALFSLIIKQPYTLQISKKDYPEIYWKDKSFFTINSVITGVWAVVFIANAIIFLLFSIPFNIIFSNILIAFGIAFSIVFPLKAPAFLATKEFKKNDWSVKINPQKPKGENEYDVIIVGSGIGGLSCGALLSKKGYKVLVLEQHYQVGGYCSSFQRKGFTFTTGVENVSGLEEGCPVEYLLRKLELKKEDFFVKNRIRFVFKRGQVDVNNFEDFIRNISKIFPDEKENILAFLKDAKRAIKESFKGTEEYGVSLPDYLLAKVQGERKIADFPKERPYFSDWLNKTYQQKLDQYFRNEDLKKFFCGLLPHLGTKPEETAAYKALFSCVSYYIYGGYYVKGSPQNFANGLKKFIEGHNGKVLLNCKVEKILIEKETKKIKGVRIGDKIFESSVVVSNANAKNTFLKLVGENNLNRKFIEYIKNLKMSRSCLMVSLGLNMDLSDYPTTMHYLDENNSEKDFAIIINSNADAELAPLKKASITLLTYANYYDFSERGIDEYLQKKKEMAEILIKKAEKIIPDLSKNIEVLDIATPKTFERYTSMPEGALYSFDQSVGIKRPYFKTPIKGLYLACASTFPGGGIEAVVISGIICANDICKWEVKAL